MSDIENTKPEPEFELVKNEQTGKLEQKPVAAAPVESIDTGEWWEEEDGNPQNKPTAVIYYLGKEFHIRELTRRQSKAVDDRLREIQKISNELNKLQKKVKAARLRREEPDEDILEKLNKLSEQFIDKKWENELIVVKSAVKKWNLTGKLEAPKPEQIDNMFRSRLAGLYEHVMQKSRIGSSEGDF